MTDATPTRRPMPDHNTWPAFSVPWDDNQPGPTDMSWLLEKPAGATGFVQVIDGHLATGDGRRWRIWGQNITGGAPLPPMDMAPIISRRLAKFGLNCVRLHHCDHRWPKGLLMRLSDGSLPPEIITDGVAGRDTESTRALDPEAMARLDWFVACCKRNGIYIDLNLNVSRPFSIADGVKEVEWIGFAKGLTYFDERLIALQKEYAQQLLEHVNPFTGLRYADEPAIAIIELVNENSLLDFWVRGLLRGENRQPIPEWGDIPPSYARDLDRRWNAWLAARYPDREALQARWEGDLGEFEDPAQGSVRRLQRDAFASAAPARFRDEATFYLEIEKGFFAEMEAFLRGLGARQLIVGTSDYSHAWGAMPLLEANATLDIIDGHVYWQHPRFPGVKWSRTDWIMTNTPMVDDPDHSMVAQLSRSVVQGKPYIVSEVNEPFPHDYAAECIPVLGAYALLQDWDGIFWFAYGGGNEAQWKEGAIPGFFSMANDPLKMAQTAAGALMFLRGDVRAAERTVARCMPHDWVLDSLRATMPAPQDKYPFWYPHLPGRLALVHRTAIADFHADTLAPAPGEVALPEGTIASDTGELTWEDTPEDGRVVVDTPRTQVIVGRAGSRQTHNMRLDLESHFAAVQLSSLDERPIAEAEDILMVTGARVANTDMRWTDATRRSVGDQWGHAPTRVEPVAGTLTLRGLHGATRVTAQAIDDYGQPTGEAHLFAEANGEWTLQLPLTPATVWQLVRVER